MFVLMRQNASTNVLILKKLIDQTNLFFPSCRWEAPHSNNIRDIDLAIWNALYNITWFQVNLGVSSK